jgi:hypothetical protein
MTTLVDMNGNETTVAARTPSFLDMAGSVPVAPDKRGIGWDDVLRETLHARAQERMADRDRAIDRVAPVAGVEP